jgi:hypothetical protein
VQAQLRSALAVFYALGGPALETADELADKAYSLTTQPIEMLQLATNSLGELKRLTDRDEKLGWRNVTHQDVLPGERHKRISAQGMWNALAAMAMIGTGPRSLHRQE